MGRRPGTEAAKLLSIPAMIAGGRQRPHVETPPTDAFQPGGHAWHPDRADIIPLLRAARHDTIQPIYYGSNHTFLVTLDGGDEGQSYAVYKPARGEYPLYDFPTGTLYRREIATWLVCAILGWQVVPPTVATTGEFGKGSLQLFVETVRSAEVSLDELRPMALLDILVNNADRKSEHCLPGADGKIWGIDHGLTFHVQPKLRTVLWHYAGTRLRRRERADLERLLGAVRRRRDACAQELVEMLSAAELRALEGRIRGVLSGGSFPDPRYKPVPYRW